MITIDIDKAKEIQRDVWRRLRKPKLAALDLAFMRAIEAGDAETQAEIAVEKQALRDVTLTVLPDDADGVRETIPEILLS